MEEISATIGIDMNTATPEQVAKRAAAFCLEMVDCYPDDPLARDAFEALHVAINMMRGGK